MDAFDKTRLIADQMMREQPGLILEATTGSIEVMRALLASAAAKGYHSGAQAMNDIYEGIS